MIKSELVATIAATNPHLFNSDVEKLVNAIFDEITAALSRGDRVELRGFGAFKVNKWRARSGRNPRNGAAVDVPETHHVAFRAGIEMKARLNNTTTRTASSPSAEP
jgi:integration host factor subunit beta